MKVVLPWKVLVGVTVSAAASAGLVNLGIARLVAPAEGEAVETELPGAAPGAEGVAPAGETLAAAPAGRAPVGAERPKTEGDYLRVILGRNIFDQSKIGQSPKEGGAVSDGDVTSIAKLSLRGTQVADPDLYSVAWIAKEGETTARWYSLGQEVGGVKIVAIYPHGILVARDGVQEWLGLGGKQEPVKTEGAAAPTTEDGSGIVAKSETEFVVPRSELQKYMGDMDALSGLGRTTVHRGPDGEPDGYRLSSIRRGSLGEKLGIRNGDVIHSVNGMPLNNMQSAMEAYQALQSGASFKIDVTRRGAPMNLNYEVR